MGRYLASCVNFAVNCGETNSIVTFAENYFESDERRLIWIWDCRRSDNLRSGLDHRLSLGSRETTRRSFQFTTRFTKQLTGIVYDKVHGLVEFRPYIVNLPAPRSASGAGGLFRELL